MDALRKGLMEMADVASLAFQNAGKSFGFLDDGRDLVRVAGGEDAPVVTLPDHSDEGWPEVSVHLPRGARFRYAANSPLSRVAIWVVDRAESDVLAELSSQPQSPQFSPRKIGGVAASLGVNATLKVRGVNPASTLLSIRQLRDPDAIGEVLRGRSKS